MAEPTEDYSRLLWKIGRVIAYYSGVITDAKTQQRHWSEIQANIDSRDADSIDYFTEAINEALAQIRGEANDGST